MIKLFGFASIHLRPIAEYVMLTEGRSARDLSSQEDRTLAARSKKKTSLLPLSRTVYAGFEPGPVKGKPSPQVTVGTGKGPAKGSKGDDSRCRGAGKSPKSFRKDAK